MGSKKENKQKKNPNIQERKKIVNDKENTLCLKSTTYLCFQ